MPTINKQRTFDNSDAGAAAAAAYMITELPGFTEISTTLEGVDNSHVISVDGQEDVCFFVGRVGSDYMTIGLAKKGSNGYSVFRRAGSDYSGGDVWLRCYTSASSASDRLITIGYSNTPGITEYGQDSMILMVGKDVEENTVYGYGGQYLFEGLYCIETDIFVDINFWRSTQSDRTVPENLNDKAVLTKAVNFCHPNLIEMKNFYTAIWRPRLDSTDNLAQRYLISSGLWGFACKPTYSDMSILFDPALKI